jgi:hypothetical protein
MQSGFLSRHRRLLNAVVFLAILSVAAGLTAPVILKLQEASNRRECASNLRQIGIASHNYHNDWQKLPPGYYGALRLNGPTNVVLADATQRGPWAGALLVMRPYMQSDDEYPYVWSTEKSYPSTPPDPAHQKWNCGLNEERDAWWRAEQNLKPNTGQIKFKYLICPSDNAKESASVGTLYATHIANGSFQMFVGPSPVGRTNYTAIAGAAGDFDPEINKQFGNPPADFSQWIGCMYNRSTLTLGQITVQDGTSNTLLFGESLGGSVVNGRDTAWSWFGVGAMGTAYGLGRATVPAPIDPPPLGTDPPEGNDGAAWYRFSSRHPHVVQFCFADVSVRGLRYGTTTMPETSGKPPGNNSSDWAVLQQLAGRKDGFKNDTARLIED